MGGIVEAAGLLSYCLSCGLHSLLGRWAPGWVEAREAGERRRRSVRRSVRRSSAPPAGAQRRASAPAGYDSNIKAVKLKKVKIKTKKKVRIRKLSNFRK
jgi:hypothetical protein